MRFLYLGGSSDCVAVKELPARVGCKQMYRASDESSPFSLVARAEPGSVVAMEVRIEQNQIAPMRILLKLWSLPIYRPPTRGAAQKDRGYARAISSAT